MSFRITCECGAVIPPERLVGLRLDQIPKMCDDCAAASKAGRKHAGGTNNTPNLG